MTAKKKVSTAGKVTDILQYAPAGYTLRPNQIETLLALQGAWDKADVFIIPMPVAGGKSLVATTISRWSYGALGLKSAIGVPNNILLNQYTDEFKWLPTLKAQSKYECNLYEGQSVKFSCQQHKKFTGSFCGTRECCYLKDVRKSQTLPTGVYNYHTLLAYKMFREVMVFDECHNLRNTLVDTAGKKLWQHEYKFPNRIRTYGQLYDWVSQNQELGRDKKLQLLKAELESGKTRFLVEKTEENYRGEMRPLIKLNPLDVSDAPPLFWPEKKVKKLVLLSATFNLKDAKDLGLDRKRICVIPSKSPIPKERRPLYVRTDINMSFHAQEKSLPIVAEEIKRFLAERPGRGLIHAPYMLAEKLRLLLNGESRILWHNNKDKIQQLDEFKNTEGAVLVASGMYEGVSLGDDLARWQIILKVPWPNMAEPAMKYKVETDPEFYTNVTLKDLCQAYGRVCRHEEDFGETWIYDASFKRLWKDAEALAPDWFKEVVTFT